MIKIEKIFLAMAILCIFLVIFAEVTNPKYKFLDYPNVLSSTPSVFGEISKVTPFDNLKKALAVTSGSVSFYAKNLNTGEEYGYKESLPHYAASLFKVPLAVETMKQIEAKKIKKEDVEDLLILMLKRSDNSAQESLTQIIDINAASKAFEELTKAKYGLFYNKNESNAKEISNMFENLTKTKYISKEDSAYLIKLMSQTSFDDRITKHLKNGLSYSHKIGNWPESQSWHDCGLVFGQKDTYTICLMSEDVKYEDFLKTARNVAEFLNKVVDAE